MQYVRDCSDVRDAYIYVIWMQGYICCQLGQLSCHPLYRMRWRHLRVIITNDLSGLYSTATIPKHVCRSLLFLLRSFCTCIIAAHILHIVRNDALIMIIVFIDFAGSIPAFSFPHCSWEPMHLPLERILSPVLPKFMLKTSWRRNHTIPLPTFRCRPTRQKSPSSVKLSAQRELWVHKLLAKLAILSSTTKEKCHIGRVNHTV